MTSAMLNHPVPARGWIWFACGRCLARHRQRDDVAVVSKVWAVGDSFVVAVVAAAAVRN